MQANASEQFQECKMAYQTLIDSTTRDKYNRAMVGMSPSHVDGRGILNSLADLARHLPSMCMILLVWSDLRAAGKFWKSSMCSSRNLFGSGLRAHQGLQAFDPHIQICNVSSLVVVDLTCTASAKHNNAQSLADGD